MPYLIITIHVVVKQQQACAAALQPRFAASRSPPAAGPTAPESAAWHHRQWAAKRTCRSPVSCNLPQNADVTAVSAHLVCITHPFHPFAGQQLVCVGERYNRSGKRLLLRVDDGTICSVPPQWTDIAVPDPEVLMGQGRALFRVADLVELARLVTRLSAEKGAEAPVGCKDKSAADVKQFVPQ